MTDTVTTSKPKRLSKSARSHARRVKAKARKTGGSPLRSVAATKG
jgi:hypothetical protein